MTNKYWYYVNLNERGDFNADIIDSEGTTIYEIRTLYHLNDLVELGYMSHYQDVLGLKAYLIELGYLSSDSSVYRGNESRFNY